MSSSVDNSVEACETKSCGTTTPTQAINTILERTKSLERLLVHRNPGSFRESDRNGIGPDFDGIEELKADFRIRRALGRLGLQYELETVVLKHRQIIALVNKGLNNLYRYTLEVRLKILEEHHQDFLLDIKTFEEYLFLLRKLDVKDDKDVTRKISNTLELMAESTAMRNSIEARINEVDLFLSNDSIERLSLQTRRKMMLDLGVRHGASGSALSLRDHSKFPQLKYSELLDIKLLREQANGETVVSRGVRGLGGTNKK